MEMTFEQLKEAVESKEIIAGMTDSGRERFFISTFGDLCSFAGKSRKKGFRLYPSDIHRFRKFFGVKPEKTPEQKLVDDYRVIGKYKRLASTASFTNRFIEDCKRLPDFQHWKADPKGLYELGITTGNAIDGKVISLTRIGKQYPHAIEKLREAIKNQTEGRQLSYGKFAGYDISISTQVNALGFAGFLSLEFAGCGNGYYYLLINDENFIGYDVD